jgi:RsiW-degrading membrane proteinase PrsW (M82 family)
MTSASGKLSDGLKMGLGVAALLWGLLGVPIGTVWSCSALVAAGVGDGGPTNVGPAVLSFMLVVLTGGAGLTIAWHAFRSLSKKPSRPMRLFPAWPWACLFVFCLISGWFVVEVNLAPALFFPPVLLLAAAAPPLLAIAWFTGQPTAGLTWRRGLVALAGGATVSVILAVGLELLLPVVVMALVAGLADRVLPGVEALLTALAGQTVATTLARPSFVFVFVQLALVAPLVEEFVKPLVTLPLLKHLPRREAFLVAALAGAGFAALENVLYAGWALSLWAGLLLVRALGSAIHPLGAGLVGLGWRDLLRGEPQAGRRWGLRFGLAFGIHALWNGGSLLIIALAPGRLFGRPAPELSVLGFSAAGTTLALLAVLGLAALGIGRTLVRGLDAQVEQPVPGATAPAERSDLEFILSDRAVAIWALACLVAIVPAGITGLQLLMR